MVDLDNYINKLHQEIEHLKCVNKSLRTEIRTQRYEISQHKDTIKTLLEWDKPSEHNNQMDFHA